jgi:hypothetical protein
MKNIDNHLNISDYYKFSDESKYENLIIKLKSNSESFSTTGLKNYLICRDFLRNINKYNRIIRRA